MNAGTRSGADMQTLKKLVILSPKICVWFVRMCRSCGCGRYVPEDEILAATTLAPTGNCQFNPLSLEFYLFFLTFLSLLEVPVSCGKDWVKTSEGEATYAAYKLSCAQLIPTSKSKPEHCCFSTLPFSSRPPTR